MWNKMTKETISIHFNAIRTIDTINHTQYPRNKELVSLTPPVPTRNRCSLNCRHKLTSIW